MDEYKQKLEKRLEQLCGEQEDGKAQVTEREGMRLHLAQLDEKAPELRRRMTRIGAAIQVLEEVLGLREVE